METTKDVMDCEASSLMLYEEATHDLSWHITLGDKADKLKEMGRMKLGQGIAGWVAEKRESTLVADTYNDTRFFKGADSKTGFRTRSIVCVPLLLGEKLVGVLQALNPRHKPCFEDQDLEVFEAYGAMAATAIEKVRWQESMIQQQKADQELEIAQEIQSRFLSQQFNRAEADFQLSVYSHSAFQVGGDFYDVQERADGSYAVVLGDVTGKGVPAALLMAQVLSEFRNIASRESDPSQMLARMNECLSLRSARGMFATTWCARVSIHEGSLEIRQASAGHLPPIYRSKDGAHAIDLKGGVPLGLVTGESFPSSDLTLEKGEILCVYTDGITEARNHAGEEFGIQKLQDLLASQVPDASICKEAILRSLQQYCPGIPQF
jgi:sigma-B regulation protein RsbU (phosphoserine phosphatase)